MTMVSNSAREGKLYLNFHQGLAKLLFRQFTDRTGDYHMRTSVINLENMAEEQVTASASLCQILSESVRHSDPDFVNWLSS